MKLIHIVGCRPNFIKLAPVYRAAKDFEQIIIHTGQHYDYDMSKSFFEELEIPEPDINLGVRKIFHGAQTGEMLAKIEHGLLTNGMKEAIVIVYGDTNSTLAGALAASKLNIPIAHIEAGLRSYDRTMPEEINRVIVDHISDLLFCPSEKAMENLGFEGIYAEMDKVYNPGDVMFDSFVKAKIQILSNYKNYILVTIHRAKNTDSFFRLQEIHDEVVKLADEGEKIIWPVHPKTKRLSEKSSIYHDHKNVRYRLPISYKKMLTLILNAKLVITDSGGIQKEAFWSEVPCITIRDKTEWVETIKTGWNGLCEPENICETVKSVAKFKHEKVSNPYGNGHAAERIVERLRQFNP